MNKDFSYRAGIHFARRSWVVVRRNLSELNICPNLKSAHQKRTRRCNGKMGGRGCWRTYTKAAEARSSRATVVSHEQNGEKKICQSAKGAAYHKYSLVH